MLKFDSSYTEPTPGQGCPRAKLQAVNWLSDVSGNDDCNIVEVSFKNTRTGYYINRDGLSLKLGDKVVVESQPGYDIGCVNMTGRLVRLQMKKSGIRDDAELRNLLRFPTAEELDRADEAYSLEHDTMIRARKIAEDLALNMKIGDVEYQADAAKAIFYYIADERVDFRALIRVLADTFKVRVEMRQIGARQEAGRIGGIGPCGRPLCCSQWMTRFVSVGTGAARMQDLSINPQKLAGQCAKLKCCLNFETPTYAEAQKQMPPKDLPLETKDNTYYVFKPDTLARKITYSTDKRIPANLVTIEAARAFEIIALNRQGIKPDSITSETGKNQSEQPGYIDLLEQESVTRFDKSKNKKKKKSGSTTSNQKNLPPKPAVQKPNPPAREIKKERNAEEPVRHGGQNRKDNRHFRKSQKEQKNPEK